MPVQDPYVHLKLPKATLQHGHYYAGFCRNARIARWDAERQLFTHWRTKFAYKFTETIEFWEDDGQFDQFLPLFDLGDTLEPIELEKP